MTTAIPAGEVLRVSRGNFDPARFAEIDQVGDAAANGAPLRDKDEASAQAAGGEAFVGGGGVGEREGLSDSQCELAGVDDERSDRS